MGTCASKAHPRRGHHIMTLTGKRVTKNLKRKGGEGKKRWCHAIDTRKKLGYILDYWCDGDNANKNLI